MARRKSTRGRNKIQPAVMTLSFQLPSAPFQTATTSFIDLSQVTSLVNRRFMRQGLNWAVGGFKFLSSTGFKGQISVTKLPNTWVMSNSWEKSFRAWTKMNNEAMQEADSVRPKFLDFKIYADANHHAQGYTNNLLPYNVDPFWTTFNAATPGEWESAKVFVPEPYNTVPASGTDTMNTLEMIAVGASYPGAGASGHDAVSLIEGYAASRALPNLLDPNTPADADDVAGSTPENWLSAIFNEGTTQTADVIDELTTENNLAPYPFEGAPGITDTMYPNGANQLSGLQIHSSEFISGTTVGGTTRIKGGNFPCGLIGITQFQEAEGGPFGVILEIDLVPGNHRGYLCEPMTEM
jgi:hypothetical protein